MRESVLTWNCTEREREAGERETWERKFRFEKLKKMPREGSEDWGKKGKNKGF